MLNDYQRQAALWDWDAYDNTAEYEYWCGYAGRFGKNVLIPMCAHGQSGAFMAQKGFYVTAFDITPEMIEEGKKRYGSIGSFELVVADILDLNLQIKNFDFSFIAGNGDLHLLKSTKEVETAFISICSHMRAGSGLALELTLPGKESWSYPKSILHPRVANYTDKKIWKENKGWYDADEKRHYINQTVYVENKNGTEAFTQSLCLQYYEREEILNLLNKCGFVVKSEYSDRQKKLWTAEDDCLIIEAIKSF